MHQQNLRTFIDSLDNFLVQLQKQAASEDVTTGHNTEDSLVNDTELDIPRDENVTEPKTYEDHEEDEEYLDEYSPGHSSNMPENKDSNSLPHRQTELSPDLEEGGEGEIPSKDVAKDLGETETDITTEKQSNYKLASSIKELCYELESFIKSGEKVGFVARVPTKQEKYAAAQTVKDAYEEAIYVLDFLFNYKPLFEKISQDYLTQFSSSIEKLAEGEDAAGTEEEFTIPVVEEDNAGAEDLTNNKENPEETGPSDIGVSTEEGNEGDLTELLNGLSQQSGELGLPLGEEEIPEEEPPPEESEKTEKEKPEESSLEKESAVIAQLFSEALDYLGLQPADLLKARKLSKQASANLYKAVSQYRLAKKSDRQYKLGRSKKYAKLFNQLTDYIRDIMR
jgi:hypothetical protein